MTLSGIVLVVAIGYSPSGASGTSLEVMEYSQPSLDACSEQAKVINENTRTNTFRRLAFCISTSKEN